MIEIKDVSLKFDNKKILDNISFTIPDGCVYGFLGNNGAGKSTLMRIICGILDTDHGTVTINEQNVYDNSDIKEKIFFVNDETTQYTNHTLDTLRKYYKYVYKNFSDDVFNNIVNRIGLPTDKKLSTFSKGMKRQAIVILGLSCMTDYLILDEAFDGLDPAMRKLIKQIICDEIYDRNGTIIVSSHNLTEINEICDKAMLIHDGKLIFNNDIDEIKSEFCKVQMVFKSNPPVKEQFNSLGFSVMSYKQTGSIVQIILHENEESALKKLEALNADLIETVPLTLEEIFIYEMEAHGYAKYII